MPELKYIPIIMETNWEIISMDGNHELAKNLNTHINNPLCSKQQLALLASNSNCVLKQRIFISLNPNVDVNNKLSTIFKKLDLELQSYRDMYTAQQ
jgi:hypothetical protein